MALDVQPASRPLLRAVPAQQTNEALGSCSVRAGRLGNELFYGRKPLLSFFTKQPVGFPYKGLYTCLESLLLAAVSSVSLWEMCSYTQKSALLGLSLYPACATHVCLKMLQISIFGRLTKKKSRGVSGCSLCVSKPDCSQVACYFSACTPSV